MATKDFTKKGNPAYRENTALNGLIDTEPVKEKAQAAPVPAEADILKNFVVPDKKTRCKRVQILITEEMFSRVKATATAGKVSVNEVINQALAHFYS